MSDLLNYTSTGCPAPEVLPHDPVPFFSDGELNFKAHDVGWLCCGVATVVASSTSVWLIRKHLSFFYHPQEQGLIVRLLFMPVIYSICSFLSYFYYKQALYFQLGRDCYEALIIASFFFLLLSYLSNPVPTASNPHPQPFSTKPERLAQLRHVVKELHLKKWMWPLGWWKWRPAGGGPREGEAFLWWMRVCIGQYVLVRPISTLASVVGEASGYYCLASWSPKFVHVWSSAAVSISVTVAMYAVLQLYMPLKKPLAPSRPMLKFLLFWQETFFSFLVTVSVIKHSTYFTAEEICIGLSALCACFEMVVFAFLHVKAFTYLPYRALAAPLPLDGSSPRLLDDDLDDKDPSSTPLTFAQWDAWEKKQQAREKALARLAKPKLPKHADDSELPLTKADGSPLLQETKKWPALLKCLNLADVWRELVEEGRFVFRGGKIDEKDEALLEERRKEDLEAALGQKREKRSSGGYGGYGGERPEGETGFERELRRIRDGEATPRGAKVGADGSLIFPPSHPSKVKSGFDDPAYGVGATDYQQRLLTGPAAASRWAGIEESARPEPTPGDRSGRLNSVRNFGSAGRRYGVEAGTFEQVPCLGYSLVAVDNIPTLTTSSSLAIPAPHRLGSPSHPTFHHPPAPLSTPSASRSRSTFEPLVTISTTRSVKNSRRLPSASSNDSQNHLPHESRRTTSYVPVGAKAKTPSPPPFSHFRRQSAPPVPPSPGSTPTAAFPNDGFTAFTPISPRLRRPNEPYGPQRPQPTYARPQIPHAHSQSVPVSATFSPRPSQPVLTLSPPSASPPRAILMAKPESRQSRGLPPDANLSGQPEQSTVITCLAGCDFLTISPSLLKDLQGSTEQVKPVLAKENLGEPLEKVSFVDNEPAFRWSLLQDGMAFTKLHEGIKKFAEDAEELKSLLKAQLQ
ncbi:hypothetical protein JCM11641_004943 [Rhodosporidiobolus odoratus]